MYNLLIKKIYKIKILVNIAQIMNMKKPDNVVFDIQSQEYDS